MPISLEGLQPLNKCVAPRIAPNKGMYPSSVMLSPSTERKQQMRLKGERQGGRPRVKNAKGCHRQFKHEASVCISEPTQKEKTSTR